MAYANHVTKQLDSYSVDSMALSLNVLFCVLFMNYLEGSYLVKNPQETIFSVVKSFFLSWAFPDLQSANVPTFQSRI